jgi:tellurite resistance protein TerB
MLQEFGDPSSGRRVTLGEKLRNDIERFRDRAFLKATMAASALVALADGEVSLEERYRIDAILEREPSLARFPASKAVAIFQDYVHALKTEPDRARRILFGKVEREAVKPRRARTLMRVAWLIIAADEEVQPSEAALFEELCRRLSLDPEDVRRGVPVG